MGAGLMWKHMEAGLDSRDTGLDNRESGLDNTETMCNNIITKDFSEIFSCCYGANNLLIFSDILSFICYVIFTFCTLCTCFHTICHQI